MRSKKSPVETDCFCFERVSKRAVLRLFDVQWHGKPRRSRELRVHYSSVREQIETMFDRETRFPLTALVCSSLEWTGSTSFATWYRRELDGCWLTYPEANPFSDFSLTIRLEASGARLVLTYLIFGTRLARPTPHRTLHTSIEFVLYFHTR